MIKQITIKNYILIDELFVEFDKGFNVITGETGAGKSIVINAIDLVFAPRVSKEIIKSGADKAVIELVLVNADKDLSALFDKNGVDFFEDEIVITKEISQNSVRTRVNGTLVNQDFIRVLKEKFLDIHSQHQVYSLLQPKFHINLLDSYAKDSYGGVLGEFKNLYSKYQGFLFQLESAKSAANVTESQIDFLKFQIREIEDAQITDENEDEILKNELSVLENIEKLKELTGSSYWTLSQDDNSILNAISIIKMNIAKASRMDEKLSEVEEKLIEAADALSSVSSQLRDYSQNSESDGQRLNDIQERIFLLDKIKRKYGGSLEEVLKTYEKLCKDYEQIEFSTKNIDELEANVSSVLNELNAKADKISEFRKKNADVLASLIVEKLEKLEIPKAKFKIAVEQAQLSAIGKDSVEFLISTNISEGLKPLSKVASGGEISRVMLAIKSIFAKNDEIDTVIFDEIDTGISGKTSQSVAEELVGLSKKHQVILITHQPIIASKADKHFYVTKKQENGFTAVDFVSLEGENKIRALAELAGGEVNEQSLQFARSL